MRFYKVRTTLMKNFLYLHSNVQYDVHSNVQCDVIYDFIHNEE